MSDRYRLEARHCRTFKHWRLAAALVTVLAASGCGVDTNYYVLETLQTNRWTLPVEAARIADREGVFTIRVRRLDETSDIVLYSGELDVGADEIALSNVQPELRSDTDLRLCLNGAQSQSLVLQINPEARSVVESPGYCPAEESSE